MATVSGMFECRVEAGFSAAHRVRMYDGAFEEIHGHDWRVEAVFRGPSLDEIGLLVDFVAAQQALREVVTGLHHTLLNDAPLLAGLNPTAEHVALRIFERLLEDLAPGAPLVGVCVHEAPGCMAAYWAPEAGAAP